MSVTLRGNIWHYRFAVKGHIVTGSTHTSNRREAERIEASVRSQTVQDVVLNGKRPTTLHGAIKKYQTSRTTDSSKRNARLALVHFLDIPDKPMRKVEGHELEAVIQKSRDDGRAESVIALRTNYWNAFVNWCNEQKYIAPPKLKQTAKPVSRIRWLTLEEQNKLLDAIGVGTDYRAKNELKESQKQDNRDLLVFLLDTGVRYMECAKMQWTQVDFAAKRIHVRRSKGGNDTTLAISSRLLEVLERRKLAGGDFIFPSKKDKNNNHEWIYAAVKRAGLSNAQGNVTLHVMRHTFASTMLQNGMSLVEVQHLLGHKTLAMTAKYSHFVKQDTADKSAEILDKLNKPPEPEKVVAKPRSLRLVKN